MSDSEDEVNHSRTLIQAIVYGVLVNILENSWRYAGCGKPIIATAHLYQQVSPDNLMEIWNKHVDWQENVLPTLPKKDQLFSTYVNGEKVWVIEDDHAFIMMYPEDY